ncbi:MAG TPA: hypothetical protein PL110_10970 [Candidatus Eremiobacteraeota bacterium]|nr:MAG: hypothetical protein BWY64_02510 [bacterium ADurb.Bin363]HPZ08626.1 hypothetical protein [Candidatus Eremiobacteraeota bacterium]
MHRDFHYCELINPSLTINALGEAIFCCATAYNGALATSFNDKTSVAEAYKKIMDIRKRVIHQRIDDLSENNTFPGMSICDYCNKVLRDIIRPVR